MSATETNNPHRGSPALGRAARKRSVRTVAAATVTTLTAGAIVLSGGGTAAAAGLPQAQSVGNFVDATLGGNTLDSLAALKYATAKAPGSTSVQNPLDVKVLNALDLPLTGDLNLPSIAGIDLGAVNQVAKANLDGSSYGGSGAVQNSGGVSVGGDNKYPANATIDLTASGIAGNTGTIPGASALDALGGVTASIGGVSALASTPKGYGKAGDTKYQIANVDLSIGSPLLGGVLGGLTDAATKAVAGLVTSLTGTIAGAAGLPTSCSLTSAVAFNKPIELEVPKGSTKGAIEIDPGKATISVHLNELLKVLGLDLNNLPANTDLIDYLLAYLTDPNGLAKGLAGVVNGLIDPLQAQLDNCRTALDAIPVLGSVINKLIDTLEGGKTTVEDTVLGLIGQVAGAAGANPLAPLATVLKQLVDIGVNVQPNGPAGPKGAAYTDPLQATPKQGTPVVKGQTVVRAIEVNVAAAAGSSLPGLGSIPGLDDLPLSSLGGFSNINAAPVQSRIQAKAAAPGTGILTLALANAAAGPSTAAAPPTTTAPAPPSTTVPSTSIPVGVPAGQAGHGGSPVLPLVLLLLGLTLAGGGVLTFRMRGKLGH